MAVSAPTSICATRPSRGSRPDSTNLPRRWPTGCPARGLALFTDPAGAVPAGGGTPAQAGYVGFANIIGINPAVAAKPSLVRDGTQAVAGSITGASAFTPNPAGGPAGFTTLITRVTDQAFGAEAQPGVPQAAPATVGLGVGGTLSLPYGGSGSLGDLAASLVGAQSQAAATATGDLATGTALQATLAAKLQSATGVSIDTELSTMIGLQNAYGANAKVITAAQAMWTSLLAMLP